MKRYLWLALAGAISASAQNSYAIHKLVSDLPGIAEKFDRNLKNPWGIAASGTSPFWISNNHTGTATVYDSDGKPFPETAPLVVGIPGPASGDVATPTGQVFNDTGGFEIAGKPALFLFCTEQGTIAAWNSAAGTSAQTVIDNSGGSAVYKGLAAVRTADGPRLYATNFRVGTVDGFDGGFNPVPIPDELRGPLIAGYAPFNIERIGQRLYVTYAKQDDDAEDDVPGAGNGYVYVFTLDGRLVSRLIEGGALNSPWGLAIAPEFFGAFSQALLVANFGDGKINAYDTCSGEWMGTVADTDGRELSVPGLWALRAGNGHNGGDAGMVYFTAGIAGGGDIESHGLFGSIGPAAPTVGATAPPPANIAINIKALQFTPSEIVIPAGGSVTWMNGDGFGHTVKGDAAPFASGLLDFGGTFTQTFDTPGTYEYHCTIHPFMKGKVVAQ